MRVTIFDDDGNELAQGKIDDLTVNGETLCVDLSATVTSEWHPLSEGGGRPAWASIAALISHVVATQGTGKVSVRLSSGPAVKSPGREVPSMAVPAGGGRFA